MTKDTKRKTRCPKNYTLSEVEVANLAGCSVSYVKQIRLGTCNLDTPLAKTVLEIDKIAIEGKSLLIQEIERVIQL